VAESDDGSETVTARYSHVEARVPKAPGPQPTRYHYDTYYQTPPRVDSDNYKASYFFL